MDNSVRFIVRSLEKLGGLLDASGATLGSVRSISTNISPVPVPMYAGKGAVMAAEAPSNVPVSAGQMSVNVDVTIVYDVR